MYTYYMYVNERKEERSKQGQTNKKAKQHAQVGFEPTPLHILDRALYQLSCLELAGLKSYIIVHLINRLTIN